MRNLAELALNATKENIVKKSKKENINDSLVRILYNEKQKLTRIELIARISLDRLKVEFSEEKLIEMVDNNPNEFAKLMQATNKTVKNGLDTSISRSNNNSSFHYNEKYSHLKLDCKGDQYFIVDAK